MHRAAAVICLHVGPSRPALARRTSYLTARVDNVVICGRTLTRSILSPVELPVQAGFHDTLCLTNADVRKRAQNGREGKASCPKTIIVVFEKTREVLCEGVFPPTPTVQPSRIHYWLEGRARRRGESKIAVPSPAPPPLT